MGKRALRKELGKILRQNGMGKLYTCHKLVAHRILKTSRLIAMINFLRVKPGDKAWAYGCNQVVKELVNLEWWDCRGQKGGFYIQADSVKYESGYQSCGCGSWDCFNYPPQTKEVIVAGLKKNLSGEWVMGLSKDYFEALERGKDILTDDGYLIDDWLSYVTR